MNITDRKAINLRLLETTDFDALQQWFKARMEKTVRDFCTVPANDHGALAQAQGQIREIVNYLSFQDALKREIEIFDQIEKAK